MPVAPLSLDELRRLSGFDGDARTALRTLHATLAQRWPGIALGFMLVHNVEGGQCRLAGLIGPEGNELVPADDPYGQRIALPLFDDSLSRALILVEPQPHVLDIPPLERGAPLAQALLMPAAVLALPMARGGDIDHWLLLASTLRHRFDDTDRDAALNIAALVYSLIGAQLTQRTLEVEVERQHREIEGLADLQRILQPEAPRIRGLDLAVHWQPADTAAGDYYDFMALTPFVDDYVDTGADVFAVMLADVSGHGAVAAMEAVQFDAILRTYEGNEPPGGPAGALNYANRYFFSRRQRRHFMTAFVLSGRPDRDEIQYVCAGHLPALMRRGDDVSWLGREDDADIPIGILRDHRWDNRVAPMHPGDLVVLYTDGIVETRNGRGEPFGLGRLWQVVAGAPLDADATLAAIRDAVIAWQGAPLGVDDQTIIVMRRHAATALASI